MTEVLPEELSDEQRACNEMIDAIVGTMLDAVQRGALSSEAAVVAAISAAGSIMANLYESREAALSCSEQSRALMDLIIEGLFDAREKQPDNTVN